MMKGKVRAALQLLTKETGAGPMRLDDVVEKSGKTVRDILKDKHPQPEPPHPDALLSTDIVDSDFHPVFLIASQLKQFKNLLYGLKDLLDLLAWMLSVGDAYVLHLERNLTSCALPLQPLLKEFAPLMLIPQV